MGTSKIAVDLRARTFEIEVPDERIDEVLSRLESLLALPLAREEFHESDPSTERMEAGEDSLDQGANGTDDDKSKGSASRRRKANGKGAAKVRAYELVELGLTEEQRAEVREYFASKGPTGQNEQVAVLGVQLKKLLGKADLTADEIHSAFKIVDKATPRNLIAVFGNMKREGRANYTDNKIIINSHTEDFVNYHMGKKDSKKK